MEQSDTKAAVTEEKGHSTPRVQQLIYIRIDIFFFILAGFSEFWPAAASSAVIKLVTFSLNTYPCKHCVYILKKSGSFLPSESLIHVITV